MRKQSEEEKALRAAFSKAAEQVNLPERKSLSANAQEAEAVLEPKLDELKESVEKEFEAAGLTSMFNRVWDVLLIEHLVEKGWSVEVNGGSMAISG